MRLIRRKTGRIVGLGVLAALLAPMVQVTPVFALDGVEQMILVVAQVDGSPTPGSSTFDATAGAGNDTGSNNAIVRTNDLLQYQLTLSVNPDTDLTTLDPTTATNVTFRFDLPRGTYVDQATFNLTCPGPGSGVTNSPLPQPFPVTATTWTTLPIQSVTCNVGTRNLGSTFTYQIPTNVRGEVPNGTVLTLDQISVTTDRVTTPVIGAVSSQPGYTNPCSLVVPVNATAVGCATVSARPKADISKNSLAVGENTGYFYGMYSQQCPNALYATRVCQYALFPISITIPQGGRGSTPLAMPITFTDDLTPQAMFPSAGPAAWAAMAANPDKYGVAFAGCSGNKLWSLPYGYIGESAAATSRNSVRNSGTWSCTQPAPGQPLSITITGADTTANTCPVELDTPVGTIPADRCVIIAGYIAVQVPIDNIIDFGLQSPPSSGNYTISWDNKLTNFAALGIDGSPNDPTADVLTNNHRGQTLRVEAAGSMSKYFVGVPGVAANGQENLCAQGYAIYECPPGQTTLRSGDGTLLPGQEVISLLDFRNNSSGPFNRTWMGCDVWDPTKLELAPGNYAYTPGGYGGSSVAVSRPSGGAAVWNSMWFAYDHFNEASNGIPYYGNNAPALTIEYGNGPYPTGPDWDGPTNVGNPVTSCDDTDSPNGWFTDPNLVTDGSTAGIQKVNKVRVRFVQPPDNGNGSFAASQFHVAIAQRAKSGLADATVLPNWASVKAAAWSTSSTPITTDDIVSNSYPWTLSTFNPTTGSGILGDRIRSGSAFARIRKEVQDPLTGNFTTLPPKVAAGANVNFRLYPTLNAGVSSSIRPNVVVEDCMDASEVYVSANPVPNTIIKWTTGGIASANLTCNVGQTYIKWDLGPRVINDPIPVIEYTIKIKAVAAPSNPSQLSTYYNNIARITAEGDNSPANLRTSSAQVIVVSPIGIKIEKSAITPVVEINRVGETNPDPISWEVSFANIGDVPFVGNIDIVDVLPSDGMSLSDFHGTTRFESLTLLPSPSDTTGSFQVWYTKGAPTSLSPDGSSPTNGPSGATVWCNNFATTATVMSGAGTSADCPANKTEVTGLRVLRAGPLYTDDNFAFQVDVIPEGNDEGDIYYNRTAGRAVGVQLIVGPVEAPVTVVESSLGDRVWIDADGDGRQDVGEASIAGATVNLTGSDADGNAVTASTMTNGFGNYTFSDLQSGNYVVSFNLSTATTSLPTGWVWTGLDTGSNSVADDMADSDVLGEFAAGVGSTGTIALPDNTDVVRVDAGISAATGRLSGRVTTDLDDDGVFDGIGAGETTLPGVEITLTGVDALGRSVNLTTTTGPGGTYQFTGLWPGQYTVTQDQSTVSAELLDGRARIGSQGADSLSAGTLRPRGTSTQTSTPIALATNATGYDFFERIPKFAIGDRLFADVDGDGIFTSGIDLPAPAGVTVNVYSSTNTTTPAGSGVTDANGVWRVEGLLAGQYRAVIPATMFASGGIIEGWLPQTVGVGSPDADANEGLDHHAIAGTGGTVTTGLITLTVSDGGEPTGDNANLIVLTDPLIDADSLTNFTLDMALLGPASVRVDKEVCSTGSTCAQNAATGAGGWVESTLVNFTEPVTWRIIVTNTGRQRLNNVTVTDAAVPGCARTSSTIGALASMLPGASQRWTCTTSSVTAGFTNTAIATGTRPNAATVADSDSAEVETPSPTPAIRVTKFVNGSDANTAPGLFIVDGDTASWTYQVRNAGNVPLSGVTITDDAGTAGTLADDFVPVYVSGDTNSNARLELGEVWLYESPTSENLVATPGAYVNVVTVAGTSVNNSSIIPTDTDTANHWSGVPSIDVAKSVQAQPADTAATAPLVAVDGTLSWTIVVTNNGTVDLANVIVNDLVLGDASVSCADANGTNNVIELLEAGDTINCAATSTATLGSTTNRASASGEPVNSLGDVVTELTAPTDSDSATYVGISPSINVAKSVQTTFDADSPNPGPQIAAGAAVQWTFTVTNPSAVDLTEVVLSDDMLDESEISCAGGLSNAIGTLAAGQSIDCSVTGTAIVGAYRNTASVSGVGPATLNTTGTTVAGTSVSATDDANYQGVTSGVELVKYTQDSDNNVGTGPQVRADGLVKWTYKVTNTGNSRLVNVTVTDDQIDDGASAINCGGTAPDLNVVELEVGESVLCSAVGIAVLGQYQNTGAVIATGPETFDVDGAVVAGATVTDEDPDHYFGVVSLIDINKSVQSLFDADSPDPGPAIAAGTPVKFTFVVTNLGNSTLTNVAVNDDQLGAISCPKSTLLADEEMTCERTAAAAGVPHRNVATVEATGPITLDEDGDSVAGEIVVDSDDANYRGVAPSISIVTKVNGADANTTPGITVELNADLNLTYEVTNTGAYPLTDVVVADSTGLALDCGDGTGTIGTLQPGQTVVCTARIGATPDGQRTFIGTATGTGPSTVNEFGVSIPGVATSESDPANVTVPAPVTDQRGANNDPPPVAMPQPEAQTPPPVGGKLPGTGSDIGRTLWIGGLAAVFGTLLSASSRRRNLKNSASLHQNA
jgi:uncharacterized repeat protein (TIGR01451 family)